MSDIEDVKHGWEFMAKVLGADLGVRSAHDGYANNVAQNEAIRLQNEQIAEINNAIDALAKSINEHPKRNLDADQFKGFVAEEMHAGTFNIEAIRQGSTHRAWTPQENGYGSVDIETNFGKEYSLKYSSEAKNAEAYQAELNVDTRTPKYAGQERLIAEEQVEEAKRWAVRRHLKDIDNRPDVAAAHADTEQHLVGRVSDGEGIESRSLSAKESERIAKEAKGKGFDPEKHGITKAAEISEIRIDYVKQALQAGLTAAAITAITEIIPELYKAIDYLIKNGEIDLAEIRKSGTRIVSDSGESFLRGAIAYGVEIWIQEGHFGEVLKKADPSIIGAAVAIILGTIKDAIFVAAGKMTPSEMGIHFVDNVIVSAGYLAGMKVGVFVQTLLPQLPGIGFAIGSLLGCVLAVAYNIGKKKLISICVDTGFTCFGLVEQDYRIPERVLKEMGVSTIPIRTVDIRRVEVNSTPIENPINRTMYETVSLTVLKRELIGVNKVGYVVA